MEKSLQKVAHRRTVTIGGDPYSSPKVYLSQKDDGCDKYQDMGLRIRTVRRQKRTDEFLTEKLNR